MKIGALHYYIGFERDPNGLDEFLAEQGFVASKNHPDKAYRYYESPVKPNIRLVYFPEVREYDDEGDTIDWSISEKRITSELLIKILGPSLGNGMLEFSRTIMRRFDGVFNDLSRPGDFFEEDEL